MSDDSLPPPNGHDKPDTLIIKLLPCDVSRFGAEEIRMPLGDRMRVVRSVDEPPPTPPAKPTQPRPLRKSGLYVVLQAIQQHGITHPKDGYFLMMPKEFKAILVLEHKAVALVVFEVFDQTIGRVGDGEHGRQEWAPLSVRHFVRAGILSRSQAEMGIKQALAKGYIARRQRGVQRYEYAIRWRGTN